MGGLTLENWGGYEASNGFKIKKGIGF
jgi:hypothetical protein